MDTERIIDNALAGYVEVTPPSGLEQSVFNRIRSEQAVRRRSRRLLGVAFGVAAALWFVMAGIPTGRSVIPQMTPVTRDLASAQSSPVQPLAAIGRRIPKRRKRPTGEERALATLMERYPAEAQLAFADTQRGLIEPLEIEPIEIQPLSGYDPQ